MFVAHDANTTRNAKPFEPAAAEPTRRLRTVFDEQMDELKATVAEKNLEIADLHAALLRMAQRNLEIERELDAAQRPRETAEIEAPEIKRSIREICREVLADYPGVTIEDVVGVRRKRELIKPRHACMAAVYVERKDLSLPMMGKWFHRDHTTILAALRKAGVYGEKPSTCDGPNA